MIIEKPGSGYSLKKRFFANLKPNLSQVYRTLADMTHEGWIDFNKVNQDNAPNKKVYCVTPKGEEAFNRWLRDAMPFKEWGTQKHLLPYLTQIWFSYRVKPKEVVKNLETYKKDLTRRIEAVKLESKKISSASSVVNGKDKIFRELAIKGSMMQMEAIIEWMDYAKNKIFELQKVSGKSKQKQ